MHPAAKILIAIIAALLTWAAIEARAGQTPAQTVERLERLMRLKDRADRAEAQHAKAEWAKDGRRMKAKAEQAERGRKLQAKAEQAERGQRMKAKREWAAEAESLAAYPVQMEWVRQNPDQYRAILMEAEAHRYSPLGLVVQNLALALRRGDTDAADRYLETAVKLHTRND